jgi:hypothetical protein
MTPKKSKITKPRVIAGFFVYALSKINPQSNSPQRKEMMQNWADYLDNLKAQAASTNVITANFNRQAG